MKINKDTRHYRRFEYWRDYTPAGRKHRIRMEPKYDEYGSRVRDEDGFVWEEIPGTPISLCKYFWVVALRAPAHLTYDWFQDRPVVTAVTSVLAMIALLAIFGGIFPDIAWYEPIVAVFLGLLVVVGGGVLVLGLFWLIDFLWRRHKQKKRERTGIVTAVKQSLVGEFVKSKKRKVCPILEFED